VVCAVIAGTRPEIIKLYPVIRLFDLKKINYKFIHAGQHYDYELSVRFIEHFKIRKPDYSILPTTTSESAQQISEIISNIAKIFQGIRPSLLVVQGDTNSVLASALTALKFDIPIAHIESGLRSNDRKTPEEINRRIVDHMSTILFAPTITSAVNLKNENVLGNIHIVGNTVMDAVKLCLESNSNDNNNEDNDNSILRKYIKPKKYNNNNNNFALLTLHRSENVDNADTLKQILTALSDSSINYIFPMHPRTRRRIREFGLQRLVANTIKIVEPLGYFDFLQLLKRCKFVITDSGGIEEEITSPHISKHALILRDSTERPESIQSGHAILCKPRYHNILEAIKIIERMERPTNTQVYGSENAAEKIIEILDANQQLAYY
jgi:UDP-N-acetylglucosamine 2-epimerase (non-hydrolysing)